MSLGGAIIRLVRLPSVLTVPGDVLLGDAWSGRVESVGPLVTVAAGSSAIYLGGMALNDWADRERDASERPGRPIPAGEIPAAAALAIALALTGGSIAAARAGESEQRLRTAVALAASVWLYDLATKDTVAGPWTMALARSLDVLVGGRGPTRGSAAPAVLVGAHALIITRVSAHEVEGADGSVPREALVGSAIVTTATAALLLRDSSDPASTVLAVVALASYAWAMGSAGVAALRQPEAKELQRIVGAGVLANMPLQAALLARRGRAIPAATLLGLWPVARSAARRAAVT
jgi:4-hydroxybenzoate polyprenyltransferase